VQSESLDAIIANHNSWLIVNCKEGERLNASRVSVIGLLLIAH